MGPQRDCFVGSTGCVFFASRDHPRWIISSWGFESSWYPFDVTRTSCSRLQVPSLLVTDGSMVKTISFCTGFSPCLPYLFGHLVPRSGPISCVLPPNTSPRACL